MGTERIFGYILLVFFPIFELTCYLTIRSNRSNIFLRKRNITMIHICTIASWLAYFNLITGLFGGVYCGVYHMFLIFLPPLTVGPQMLRGVTLWGMLQHNKYMLQHGESVYFGRARILRSTSTLESKCEEANGLQSPNDDEEMNLRYTTATTTTENNDDNQQLSPKEKAARVRRKMKKIVKISKIFLIVLPIILIMVMIIGTEREFLLETKFPSCFPEPYLVLSIGRGFALIFTIAAVSCTILVRKCNDELGIRREITRNAIILFISNVFIFVATYLKMIELQLLLYVLQQICLSFSMIIIPCCMPTGYSETVVNRLSIRSKSTIIPAYGRPIPNIAGSRPSILVGTNKRFSVLDQKHEQEMTMSLDAGLCILLSSEEGISAFMEHCSREFSIENIRFWCIVNDFHKAVDILRAPSCEDKSEYDESDIVAFAEEIFHKYIEVGSESQINISASQRKEIENDLKLSGRRIERSIFDNVQREIYALMSRHSYPRFLASKDQEHKSEMLKHSKRKSIIFPMQ